MTRAILLLTGVLLFGDGVGSIAAQTLGLSHPAMVFTARAGGPNPAPQNLEIRSTPAATPGWSISPAPPAWLTISPASGTGPGTTTLTVNSTGLSAGIYHVRLTVTSGGETRTVDVFLVITDQQGRVSLPPNIPIPPLPPAAPPARYLVEFHFVGYSGLLEGYPDCKVNPNGRELMFGVLSGVEPTDPDEDAEYTGTMTRYTLVDFCDIKPRPGRPDEHDWCEMWLFGGSSMQVSFTAYAEKDRGGWLKAKGLSGGVISLGGTCDAEVTRNIRAGYPFGDDGGGGSPNGQPIQDPRGLLYTPELAKLRMGEYPAEDRKEGEWSMRVVARISP